MTRILITGGLGFIGAVLAERMAEYGHTVQVFDNLSREKTEDRWAMLRRYPNIALVRGDVRVENDWLHLDEPEVIFHFAGNPGIPWSITDPRKDFEANVIGTFNALEFARRSRAGLVFASTNRVYGIATGAPFVEGDVRYTSALESGVDESAVVVYSQRSPYGASKLAADVMVQEWGHMYGVPTICNRMGVVYGPGQYGATEQGWVGFFARQSLEGKPIVIYGNGKQVRDPLYIDDLVDLLDIEKDYLLVEKARGEVFNVGGGASNAISVREVADEYGLEYTFEEERPADMRWYVTNPRRAENVLEWKPSTPLDVGLKKTREFFEELSNG